MVHLRLYVSGQSELSERAAVNARAFCASELSDGYDLEIVDVIARPDVADQHGVVTTPTLILHSATPPRRLIGDLSDRARIAKHLGLAIAGL